MCASFAQYGESETGSSFRGRCRTGPADKQVAPESQASASSILGSVMRNLFLSPWGVDENNLIIFFVLVRPLFCSLSGNREITEAGWIKIAEGVAASKSLQNLK